MEKDKGLQAVRQQKLKTNRECQRELGENQTRCNPSRTEVLMGKELLMNWRKRQDFLFCTKLKEEAICSVSASLLVALGLMRSDIVVYRLELNAIITA